MSAFDYLDLSCQSISYIDKLVQKLGYNRVKKYYKLERGKWRSVLYQTDLLQLSDGYVTKNRELVLYLDSVLDGIGTQIGSSNPIAKGDNPPIKPNGEDKEAGDSESETDSFEDSEFDLSDGDKNEGRGEHGAEDEPGGEVGDAQGDNEDSGDGNDSVDDDLINSGDDFESDVGSDEEGSDRFPVFCGGSGHNKKGCELRKEAEDFVASLDAENETEIENVEEENEIEIETETGRKRTLIAENVDEENIEGARKLTISFLSVSNKSGKMQKASRKEGVNLTVAGASNFKMIPTPGLHALCIQPST
ncbi:hypothetical protein Salat_0642200 [Sesamum alatum]|uniref:Uncharacterized protein n=1 Tax=Sesamum alatum TaxID=300844 RepID=A0AAE2CUD1_9LAMI|nr:hypothetical protein Salat_0642200 [Sesamum alatum]